MDNWEEQDEFQMDDYEQVVSQKAQTTQADAETLQLVTRFIVGLAVMGGEELVDRLQGFQDEYGDRIASGTVNEASEDESGMDTLRYLMIGTMLRGQKHAVRRFQTGVNFSFRATSSLLKTLSDVTDNVLMRPVRKPVEHKVQVWQENTKSVIREGRAAEENGRFLVQETVPDLIDDFIDYMADSPQLAELIRTQIGEQSVGMAGLMMDNSRRISTRADNVIENVLRRLFRLPTRKDLPGSPIRGEPQTMYIREKIGMTSQEDGGMVYDFSYNETAGPSEGKSIGEPGDISADEKEPNNE